MKLNKTPKVIAGCNHHLSVRSVRSLILARVGEKTPDISTPLCHFNPSKGLFLLKEKCPLLRQNSLDGCPHRGYEVSHSRRKMAEGVGFEPTKLSFAGFQDRCTRPLCEPSVGEITRSWKALKIGANYWGSSSSRSITMATPSWL